MPARRNCLSSKLKPRGSTKCNRAEVAIHNRPTFPVLGGISGSTRTTFNNGSEEESNCKSKKCSGTKIETYASTDIGSTLTLLPP